VEDVGMRALVATVAVAVVAAAGTTVAATATATRDGLPAYTDGYAKWRKLNRKPVTAPGAHDGVKNVYASRPRGGNRRFPNGTVIVKSIADPGARGLARQVAVMRKVQGRWQWVEYTLEGDRYDVLARGSLCTSCHMQARANDWVFTKG
jgi:cytochrome P460